MTPKVVPEVEEYGKILGRWEKTYSGYRTLWERAIRNIKQQQQKPGSRARLNSDEEIEQQLASNAERDLRALEAELTSCVQRTTAIVAVATLLFTISFAVFALKPSITGSVLATIGTILLLLALVLNAAGFVVAIKPLAPPLSRAWKKPYNKRRYHTLLVTDNFSNWVYHCWLGDRRTPIITAYKKGQSVAVPLLIAAFTTGAPGAMLTAVSTIFR